MVQWAGAEWKELVSLVSLCTASSNCFIKWVSWSHLLVTHWYSRRFSDFKQEVIQHHQFQTSKWNLYLLKYVDSLFTLFYLLPILYFTLLGLGNSPHSLTLVFKVCDQWLISSKHLTLYSYLLKYINSLSFLFPISLLLDWATLLIPWLPNI